ncbi:hypothetical protein D3C75_1343280 [compost metagenome]
MVHAVFDLFLVVRTVSHHQQHTVELGQYVDGVVGTQQGRQIENADTRIVALAQLADQVADLGG